MAGTDLSVDRSAPEVAYTGMDRQSILADMLAFEESNRLHPDYAGLDVDLSPGTFLYRMLNTASVLGDKLFYRIDVVARELWSATARMETSMINAGKGVGYSLRVPEASSGTLRLTLDPGYPYPATLTPGELYSNGSETDEVFFSVAVPHTIASMPPGGTVDVTVVEGEPYQEVLLAVSNQSANQRVQLPQSSVVMSSVVITVNGVLWTPVRSWADRGPADTVYLLKFDHKGRLYAVFGDGNYGAIPALNAVIRGSFRVGGGKRGNLARGSVRNVVSGHPAVLSVDNPVGMTGGDDFESVRSARYSIPASWQTLQRAVTEPDHAALAITTAGIAKAAAVKATPGGRTVRLIAAPTGGGALSAAMKNALSALFKGAKMASTDVDVGAGFVSKRLLLTWIVYVASGYKGSLVGNSVRSFFTNGEGTGKFDFEQLAPGGVDPSTGNLLVSHTAIQAYVERDLRSIGVVRLGLERLSVLPEARPRPEGNIGTGVVGAIALNGAQRRREFIIRFTSASQFRVIEALVGYVSGLTDNEVTDGEKDYTGEGVASYAGYVFRPSRAASTLLPVLSVGEQAIVVGGNISLFSVTGVGVEYSLYHPAGVVGSVGVPYTSADGSVTFTVFSGSTAFLAGDSFSLDVFPQAGDIRLRMDEYPVLADTDFTIRTVNVAGGTK